MNAIEKRLIAAMRAGKQFSEANTVYNPDTGIVRFYSTAIAEYKNNSLWKFTFGGHLTKTTQSRINALLDAFANKHVNIKKGSVIYKDSEYFGSEWISV